MELSAAARIEAMSDYLQATAAAVLGVDCRSINADAACFDPEQLLNLFRSYVLRDLGVPLYGCDAPYCSSIRRLAKHLVRELEPEPSPDHSISDLYEGGMWAWGPVDRIVEVDRNPAAVFVLSAPRSGSTLLRVMLAGHAELYSPPELHLLSFQSMKERALKIEKLGYSWMRGGLLSALVELEGLPSGEAERRLATMETNDFSNSQVYRHLQELLSPRTLVDKTPTYAFQPAWLSRAERLFAGAHYIHLVRHPYAAIESFVRMRFHRLFGRHWLTWDENGWLYAEKCWTTANLHILNFLEKVEPRRRLLIRYEDLVSNPKKSAMRICAWLHIQLQYVGSMLSPYEGSRGTRDYRDNNAALGDPNFLSHESIDPALGQWSNTKPPQILCDATQRVAAGYNYRLA